MKLARAPLGVMLIGLLGAGQFAAAQPLAALGQLEPGQWEIRVAGAAPRNLCVTDPAAFVQLEHPHGACTHLVVTNDATTSTVHYTCAAAGWGRTTVRVSSPRAITIDTQGVAANAPFAYTAEAHRTGDCGPTTAGLQH